MAVSNKEVAEWLAANPRATDAEIAQAAAAAGVSAKQLAQVTGIPVKQVETRIAAVTPKIKTPAVKAPAVKAPAVKAPAVKAITEAPSATFSVQSPIVNSGLLSSPVPTPAPTPAPTPTPTAAPAPVSNQEVANWLRANPMATDAEIAQAAASAGVSAQQLSLVTGVPVDQVLSRAQAAAPEVQLNPGNWNYGEYFDTLKTGGDLNEQAQRLASQDPDLARNASSLFNEIVAQQQAGSDEFWYEGNTAGKEYAAADFALRLAENGISSLNQLGQTKVQSLSEYGAPLFDDRGYPIEETVTINKVTGQPLPRPELLGRGNKDLDIDYNLAFTENGQVIPYTSNRESSWMSFRENALKPAAAFALTAVGAPLIGAAVAPGLAAATQGAIGGALAGAGSAALTGNDVLTGAILGGAGGYFQGANTVAPGFGPQTDASFLAADASQLANQGISQSQIVDILSAPGYASTAAANLAASMAANGLDIGTMTNQLDNLSASTGLMSQTGSSADFLAADALQLQGQVGNNFPAIEQNLIASGVDPLVAADVSQQIAFNSGLTQADLATNLANSFGNNIYDVDIAATYPTSVLPDAGGLLSDIPGAAPVTAPSVIPAPTSPVAPTSPAANAGTTITPGKVLDAVKLGGAVAGLVGAGTETGETGFGIVPVPSDWKSPTYGQPIGQTQGLAPIDFGSRELLRGTQWEKYLNPMQPQMVPAPQTGISYNQLMNTLQGGQGGSLSLNDIISGIQGQYGQTPYGTVG